WQKGILNIQIWWKSKKSKPPAPGRFYAPGAPRFANTTTFKTLFWMSIVSCYENHQPCGITGGPYQPPKPGKKLRYR
ncbi:hypothetical protein C9F10_16495, partial [Salmonella enterica subsp. enterica serovar Poona]